MIFEKYFEIEMLCNGEIEHVETMKLQYDSNEEDSTIIARSNHICEGAIKLEGIGFYAFGVMEAKPVSKPTTVIPETEMGGFLNYVYNNDMGLNGWFYISLKNSCCEKINEWVKKCEEHVESLEYAKKVLEAIRLVESLSIEINDRKRTFRIFEGDISHHAYDLDELGLPKYFNTHFTTKAKHNALREVVTVMSKPQTIDD